MATNWSNDPILSFMRTGNSSDPYIAQNINLGIINNYAILNEIPDQATKVTVRASEVWSSSKTYAVGDISYYNTKSYECILSALNKNPETETTYWTEIIFVETTSQTPTKYQYYVDYLLGYCLHNSFFNNHTLNYQFMGKGANYFPASRIWTQNTGEVVTQTLQDLADAVTSNQIKGIWDSTVIYLKNDIVYHGSLNYISLQSNNINYTPSSSSSYWQVYNIVTKDSNQYIQVNGIELGGHMRIKYNSALGRIDIESY